MVELVLNLRCKNILSVNKRYENTIKLRLISNEIIFARKKINGQLL
jgi:hypothetical protein